MLRAWPIMGQGILAPCHESHSPVTYVTEIDLQLEHREQVKGM
jgi:hypothetical protein